MDDRLGEITPCYMVRFQRQSRHSAERLWRAITEPAEVSKWMDFPARVDLRVGGEWHLDFSKMKPGDGLPCVIVRIEPERVLSYAFGLSVIEWTLEDTADGCRYTFLQNGLVDRGENEEELSAGWHEALDCLDLHLDGQTISEAEQKANWRRLKPPYREQLDRILR